MSRQQQQHHFRSIGGTRGNHKTNLLVIVVVVFTFLSSSSHALSNTPQTPPKLNNNKAQSIVGAGDTSSFLYGKLQRSQSVYGSGLSSLIIMGDDNRRHRQQQQQQTQQRVVSELNTILWNQFGMATLSPEGSIDRDDLLRGYFGGMMEDEDTLLFLDVTSKNTMSKESKGLGSSLFSLFNNNNNNNKKNNEEEDGRKPTADITTTTTKKPVDLDMEVIHAAMNGGVSHIYLLCESHDVSTCVKAITDSYAVDDAITKKCCCTIVSPDDGVTLTKPDTSWTSIRPQDLEGELSQPVTVRDGGVVVVDVDVDVEDEEGVVEMESVSLSRHDLAEVCLQCALRLNRSNPNTNDIATTQAVRVVRVSPGGTAEDRANSDYFSMMGGKKAKAQAGTVTSVNWETTLGCFGSVKTFPKRPDLL